MDTQLENTLQYKLLMDESNHQTTRAEIKYEVYFYRWIILAIFCALETSNALMWVTFSPISDITRHYFGSDSFYGSTTGVNMLANVFLIAYLPATFLAIYSMKYLQLKKSYIIAGALTAVGAFIRYIGTAFDDDLSKSNVYWLVMLGQILAAIAQPILVNSTAALAAIWFPVEERDIATTVGALFGPLGNAMGSVLPSLLVTEQEQENNETSNDDDNYKVSGMADLMLVEFICCVVALVIGILFLKDAPPTPPSKSVLLKQKSKQKYLQSQSTTTNTTQNMLVGNDIDVDHQVLLNNVDGTAKLQRESFDHSNSYGNRSEHGASENDQTETPANDKSDSFVDFSLTSHSYGSHGTVAHPAGKQSSDQHEIEHVEEVFDQIRELLHNRDYLVLFTIFAIGVGMFNSIMTLLNQLVEPFGYSNDDAGLFGAVFIVVGIAGAGVAGHAMKATKQYKLILRVGIILCLLATTLFMAMLYGDNFYPLLLATGLFGGTVLPLLPVMMENTAECTYPIPEELSNGLMFTASNVLGLGFVFTLQFLIEVQRIGKPPLLATNIFMLAVISIAVLVSLLYKGNYKRTLHEQRQHSNVHFADGANSSGNILHADGSSRSDETSAPPISALLQTSCTSVEHGKSPGVVDVSTNSNNSSNNHSNLVRVVSQDNSSHLTFSHSQATRPSILPTNNWVNNVQNL